MRVVVRHGVARPIMKLAAEVFSDPHVHFRCLTYNASGVVVDRQAFVSASSYVRHEIFSRRHGGGRLLRLGCLVWMSRLYHELCSTERVKNPVYRSDLFPNWSGEMHCVAWQNALIVICAISYKLASLIGLAKVFTRAINCPIVAHKRAWNQL